MADVTDAEREAADQLRRHLGWQNNAHPTPEQLVAYVRGCPDSVAYEVAQRMIACAAESLTCMVMNHESQIAYLRSLLAPRTADS